MGAYNLADLDLRAAQYFYACSIPVEYMADELEPGGWSVPLTGQGVIMHEGKLWPYALPYGGGWACGDPNEIVGYVVKLDGDILTVMERGWRG